MQQSSAGVFTTFSLGAELGVRTSEVLSSLYINGCA